LYFKLLGAGFITKERERQRELQVGKISHTTNKLLLSEPKNQGSKQFWKNVKAISSISYKLAKNPLLWWQLLHLINLSLEIILCWFVLQISKEFAFYQWRPISASALLSAGCAKKIFVESSVKTTSTLNLLSYLIKIEFSNFFFTKAKLDS
jgi:hypothetical protein